MWLAFWRKISELILRKIWITLWILTKSRIFNIPGFNDIEVVVEITNKNKEWIFLKFPWPNQRKMS